MVLGCTPVPESVCVCVCAIAYVCVSVCSASPGDLVLGISILTLLVDCVSNQQSLKQVFLPFHSHIHSLMQVCCP
jgi:hypothetical protein